MGKVTQLRHSSETAKSRDIGIDIVKTMAIFSVIGVHFFLNTHFYKTNLNNTNLLIQTIIQQLFLGCIPLFMMASGYLNNNTDISTKYFKKIIPIIVIYLIYSMPALIYRTYTGEIDASFSEWISLIFKFKGNRYAWYIDMYIGLFLLSPFLNRMYSTLESKKEKLSLIWILILLTSMVSLLNGKIIKEFYLPSFWSSIYPLTYYFIGKYIKDYQLTINKIYNGLFLLGILLVQGILEYLVASNGVYKHYFTDYTSLFRLIQGYLTFLLLYKININNNFIKRIIINVSKLTLDIYLISFVTDRLFYKELLKAFSISQENYLYLMIPLILSSFTLSYIISNMRNKLIKLR